MLGPAEDELLGDGLLELRAPRRPARGARARPCNGEPHEIVFRLPNRFGEWRHLEAHVTDLRDDRHIRGVVLNARDVTERVRLEEELPARRSTTA